VARLRLALCQVDAVVGDLAGNVRRVVRALEEAEGAEADLAVFPELVITGYPPEDLLLEPAFVAGSGRSLEDVARATRRTAAVVGYVEEDRDLFNAAAVCAGGRVHGTWRKELLPNYAVFDERRWFSPGSGQDRPTLFVVGGVRVGVAICEDVWSPTGPLARYAAAGAELVVVLNASPYRRGVRAERERMLATRAADSSLALAYVNLVGGQDELVFDGGSMIFGLDGGLLAAAPQFEEGILVCDLVLPPAYRKRLVDPRGRVNPAPGPVAVVTGEPAAERLRGQGEGAVVVDWRPTEAGRPPGVGLFAAEDTSSRPVLSRSGLVAARREPAEEVYAALVLGTRDYVAKNGFEGVLVGLSGGVDSSLVATVAVDAIGREGVHGVLMPSRFSSEGSVADARALGENLGIETRTIPIEPVHVAFLELLAPSFAGRPADLTEENLQARIRGTILMSLSNKFGWLVLTTGNKSEMAVGYATLYGDMAGGFAVVKDVPKTLVYELCRWRNARAGRALVPEAVLSKPPSAELRPGQRDDQSLPPYELLDPVLEAYVEQDLGVEEIVAAGFDEDLVRRVLALVDRAEYKRRQAPPGPRVTSRAFGKDRRMPITNAFRPGASVQCRA
jgi:NAD+ synthase (glutamine-hydrolysing)